MVRQFPPAWCTVPLGWYTVFLLFGTRWASCMVHGVPPDLRNVLIVVVFAWFTVFFCMVHGVSCAWCLSVLLHGRYLIDCLELSQNEQNVRKIIIITHVMDTLSVVLLVGYSCYLTVCVCTMFDVMGCMGMAACYA